MRPFLVMGFLASTLVLAGCSGTDPHAQGAVSNTLGAAAADSAGTVSNEAETPLQPINASAILARVADGRARVTVVNVWATWCMPCREEFPGLLGAARAHAADGVRLMLVSTDFDEQLPDVHKFLAAHGVRDTTYIKRDGDQAFIDTLNPAWTGTIPVTLVYDVSGKRVAFWEGRADRARFEAAIQQALGTTPAATKEKHS